MMLQSVRDLKTEILQQISPLISVSPPLTRFQDAPPSHDLNSRLILRPQAYQIASPMSVSLPALALGISKIGTQHRLAIRVQQRSLMEGRLLDELEKKAKGEVDIQFIGTVTKRAGLGYCPGNCWQKSDLRPMLIGGSIAHHRVTAGTIGAFVKDDYGTYVLSNNHILANENRANVGDPILQRGAADGGKLGTQNVGVLQRWLALDATANDNVDAAIARIDQADINPSLLRGIKNGSNQHLGEAVPVEIGATVFKIGRTSHTTYGEVSSIEMSQVTVRYDIGDIPFTNFIEIKSVDGKPFSLPGDSGAVIVNEKMEGVGMLVAASDFGNGNSYAHPLPEVLQRLNVQLIR